MRSRSRPTPRSLLPENIRTLYREGLVPDLFQPIELAWPEEAAFEIEFCEQVLRRRADHVEALAVLGEAYTRHGDFAKGLETDLRLSEIRPESKHVHYNLACSYSLNGQKREALRALRRALDLGFADFEHLSQDTDLAPLKNEPEFQALVKRLGRKRKKAPQAKKK